MIKWGLILTDLDEKNTLSQLSDSAESNPFGKGLLFSASDDDRGQCPQVLHYLKQVETSGKIQSVDYHFASFVHGELSSSSELQVVNFITLLAAYTSNQVLSQHTCVQLKLFNPVAVFGVALPKDLTLPRFDQWLSNLSQSAVCEVYQEGKDLTTPFVLYGDLLYLNRYFQYEWFIAKFINKESKSAAWYKTLSDAQIEQVCQPYLPMPEDGNIDWQRQAVLNAIKRRFAVITGGPGTGKTTTVVKLLASLQTLKLANSSSPLHIQLVAPTGKAAQRLSESISASVSKLGLTPELQAEIPTKASTIHRLLKPRGLTGFAYNQDNRLGLDVLILDEASMVDISMMYKLFTALPEHAQVILLGDKQQLASVEAGNVLAELAQAKQNEFMVELQKSYRFDDASAIGQLASAIKSGNSVKALQQLQSSENVLFWYKAEQKQLTLLVEQAVEHYVELHQMTSQLNLSETSDVLQLFHHIAKFQLLVCVRQGDFGVEGLNSQIQSRLAKRLHRPVTAHHYAGRPIMISENAYHLDLYNGDIGVELVNPSTNQLMAYFVQGDGEVKQIHCQRLPSHETVYAMTVHKSQGSEFAHAALVLPDHNSSIVSKEIIYTGLTRAKTQFSLYAGEYNLRQGLQSSSERHSGLREMLAQTET